MGRTIGSSWCDRLFRRQIVNALLARRADIKAIARLETDSKKIKSLQEKGVNVSQVDTGKRSEISKNLIGAHCVVSALAGLRTDWISKGYPVEK